LEADYDLNEVFTAEIAENAENKHILIVPCKFCLCVLCDLERSGR